MNNIVKNIIKSGKIVIKTDELAISDQKVKILVNLGQIIKKIQDNVPETAEKLPIYYVDASIILDYLTTNSPTEEIPDRVVNDSLVAIDWLEEVPIVNGLPIWERLDCEPITEYRLFKIYRDSTNKGTSRRSFENLEKVTGISTRALYAVSKVYHWQMRVKTYDMFKIDLIEKEKIKLIRLMETTHRVSAENIFEKCITYFKGLTKTQLAKVNPKDMLGWYTEAMKANRLALGLSGDKPVNTEDRIKIDKLVNITHTDNKTLNIGKDGEGTNKYLQEMVDILSSANALPKQIEVKGDLQKELKIEEGVIDEQNKS